MKEWRCRGGHHCTCVGCFKTQPWNPLPNNRFIPSCRVRKARKFARRWDWAILGCLMRSGKWKSLRLRHHGSRSEKQTTQLTDECSDMEKDSLVGGTGLCLAYFLGLNPAEEFIHPFLPQRNSTSTPQGPHAHIYIDTCTRRWQMEGEKTKTLKKTNLSSGSSVKLLWQ